MAELKSPLARTTAESPGSGAAGNQGSIRSRVASDVLASIMVFLIALPLCMGIAIASGAPVSAGLVAGIVGGMVVAPLSGSPLQVSGPANGQTVIVAEIIRDHGLSALGAIVMIAGAIQIVAGSFRLGQWFRAISPAVVEGMLAGIGVLIVASQLHVLVDDRPKGTGIDNILSIPGAFRKAARLPNWHSREEFESRTALLKAYGAVHEAQVEIEEMVADTVANNASQEVLVDESKHLPELSARQARVLEDLKGLEQRLKQTYASPPASQWASKIVFRAREATASAEAALEDLSEARGSLARASQHNVDERIADVLQSLKSHEWAAYLGVGTILILVLWQFGVARRFRLLPAPLVAVGAATLVCWMFSLPVLYVEVPEAFSDSLHFPSTVFEDVRWSELLGMGAVIALIVSAETLLSASAVDRLHHGERTRFDRELVAQGIGNMVCGLVGALPLSGVIVRSAANVQAGAKSRLSSFLHGAWTLLAVAFFSSLLAYVPVASLAGILVYTGYRLVDPRSIQRLWKAGRGEVFIYCATLGVIVGWSLLTGIIVGIVLSAARLLLIFSRLKVTLTIDEGQQRAHLWLRGSATFLRLPQVADALDRIPPGCELVMHLDQLDFIDHACLEQIAQWVERHESSGSRVTMDWDALNARFMGRKRRSGVLQKA